MHKSHFYVTMRSLPSLVLSVAWHFCPILSFPTNFGGPSDASFDYIIIGAGTSGLAIAASLAADPSLSVAVVEAGGFYEVDNGNISVIPGDCTFYSGTAPNNTQPLVDWGFDTVPQAVCLSLWEKMVYAFVDNGRLKGRTRARYALRPWKGLGRFICEKFHGVQQASEELFSFTLDRALTGQDQPQSPSRNGRQKSETRHTRSPTCFPSTKVVSTTPPPT